MEQEIRKILREGSRFLNNREIDAITVKILSLIDNKEKEKCQ